MTLLFIYLLNFFFFYQNGKKNALFIISIYWISFRFIASINNHLFENHFDIEMTKNFDDLLAFFLKENIFA
jgi:hypothetical protein